MDALPIGRDVSNRTARPGALGAMSPSRNPRDHRISSSMHHLVGTSGGHECTGRRPRVL